MQKCSEIEGLYYIENALIKEDIINIIDNDKMLPWTPISNSPNSRKVKHYGYKYNYQSFTVKEKAQDPPNYLNDYVNVLNYYVSKISNDPIIFNQCILNNYEIGQCISKHIDSTQFGPIIGCFTLGNSAIMRFKKGDIKYDIEVKPNSLYIMSSHARYLWTHEMLSNKNGRRISITFRNIQ